jgi:ubiquinone biosynthesis protein COQ9
MDKQQAAKDIIAQALPMVPFDGWTQHTISAAAVAAGYKKTDAIRVFPGGAADAADIYLTLSDQQMSEAMSHYHLEGMKIRERIFTAVRLRLELQNPHREAMRKTVALHMQPFYAHRGLRALYNTVDAIWYAAGDTSTDFNFYTKRATLAAVYYSTLLVWLDDHSAGQEHSWEFLRNRIENVMQIEKAKHQLKSWFKKF